MIFAAGTLILAAGLVSAQSTSTTTTHKPVHKHAAASTTHSPGSKTSSSHKAPAHKTSAKSRKGKKTVSHRAKGQQKIDSQRATQIQTALIREHYLTGTPTGNWDASTQAALQKYQADNGWQSKTIPDSRALIKLGLGPDQNHLLNPESAMTNPVESVHASSDPGSPAPNQTAKPQP